MIVTPLRMKNKTLAAEGRLITQEIARFRRIQKKLRKSRSAAINSLRHHKVTVVRPEARRTQLAFAFLRNKHYALIEMEGSCPVDWEQVFSIVERFASPDIDRRILRQKFAEWQDEAEQHMAVKRPPSRKRIRSSKKAANKAVTSLCSLREL